MNAKIRCLQKYQFEERERVGKKQHSFMLELKGEGKQLNFDGKKYVRTKTHLKSVQNRSYSLFLIQFFFGIFIFITILFFFAFYYFKSKMI